MARLDQIVPNSPALASPRRRQPDRTETMCEKPVVTRRSGGRDFVIGELC